MWSSRLHLAVAVVVVGLGCREPATPNEREVAPASEPADDTSHYDLQSMYGGGDPTGPLVALCGLEIPVDAEFLHCELMPGDDPRALARLTKVTLLALFRAPDSIDGRVLVESIASLPELVDLHLGHEVHVVSLRELAGVSSLRTLTLVRPPEQVIPSLAELQQLEELQVHECAGTDYRPLAALTNLDKLVLMGSAIEDLEQIVGLGDLIELNLAFTRVRELEPLQHMQFRVLDLTGTPVVDVGLSGADSADADALARLRAGRPELEIRISARSPGREDI